MTDTTPKFSSAHLLHRLADHANSATLIRFATDRQASLDKLSAPDRQTA